MSTNASPLSSLIVKFLADSTDLHEGIKGLSEQLGEVGEHFEIGHITEAFAEIAAAAGIATGSFEIAKEALQAFSKAEDVQTSFELLTGSSEQAKDAFEGLKETAIAIAVPFEKLLDVSQRLAPQFGVGTQQLEDVLQAAGDAAAATGRDFDSIATGLDRIAITGQVSTRQLVQFGVSVSDIAQTMGVSIAEATELLKKNGQSAQADVEAVVATIEQKFGGAAEAIAQNLSGQFTNLKTELGFISEDLGAALAPLAEGLIAGFQDLEPTLKGIAEGVKPAAAGFEQLASAIGSLVPDFVKIVASGPSMVALGTAVGFTAQAGKILVDVLHAAVIETVDFVSSLNPFGDGLKHLTDDFNQAGVAITKDFAGFGDIAKLGQQAADSLRETTVPVKFDTAGATAHAAAIYGLSDAFKDLGVKTAPTQAELDKLANALEFVQRQYEAGLIPLSTYDAAVGDFTKKMTQLNGAFIPQGPIDELGEALKKAGIKNAGDELEQLQRNVAATGAAFEIGRGPASDYADAIKKLEDFTQKNSTEGLIGLGNQLEIVGEQFRLGKVGGEELAGALDNLVQAGPAFQDSILKQDDAIGHLVITMANVGHEVPTVDQVLRSFGVETADGVTSHIAQLQHALDSASAAMRTGVPGAALAAQLALQALRTEEQKLSQTSLDVKILGIPDLQALRDRVTDVGKAYQDLASKGLLTVTTALEANIVQQRANIDLAVQEGKDTTDLRIQLDATTESLKRQTLGFSDLAASLKGTSLSGLDTVFHDLLFNISGVADAFKKLGESIVDTVVNRIIKDAFSPLLDSLDSVIAKGVAALEKVAGIGVSSIPTPGVGSGGVKIPGIPGIGGDPGGLPGVGDAPGIDLADGGGAGSSSLGLASSFSSFLGAAGAIGGVVSAISGIIGNFQNARQEGSLNAIESNTRVGALYCLGALRELEGHTSFYGKSLFPELKGILDWQGYIVNSITALGSINLSALPGQIATALTPVLKPGSSGAPININIYGATDPAATADSVATMLKTLSPVFT